MGESARSEQEARAERCVRRGELSEALRIYEALVEANPDDRALAAKLGQLRRHIDPREMRSAKGSTREPTTIAPASPEQEGERLFALGDFAGAAAAYRRALQHKPDSELIRERLVELFQLAQEAPPGSPTDHALPHSTEPRLQALLDRISARKKVMLG